MTPPRAIVVRSGGLGDFLLALPLLRALEREGHPLTVTTRASYFALLAARGLACDFLDVDGARVASLFHEPAPALRATFEGAMVYSFLPDADGAFARGAAQAGARRVVALEARPCSPPHFALRALRDAGLRADAALLDVSHLERAAAPGGNALWLHPGSGSARKNAPLDAFVARARAWQGPRAFLLGEADRALEAPVRAAARALGAAVVVEPPLVDLAERLARGAAAFAGNDSGPTHLAAALGVATEALFVATDPEVWRPVGREVRVSRPLG